MGSMVECDSTNELVKLVPAFHANDIIGFRIVAQPVPVSRDLV